MSLKSTNGPGPDFTGIIARPEMVLPVPRFFHLKLVGWLEFIILSREMENSVH